MTSTIPTAIPTQSAAQNANAASNSASGTTSPSVAGAAQPTAKSYASATKKSVSPPAIASSTPQVAVGSAQHGKSNSVVNGKGSIPPAVPAVGPTIANGAGHGRKPSSMTISAAGSSGPMANGANNRPNISFGSMNAGGSPAPANSVPQAPANAAAPASNPRITSPATSPSPIPQPPASGGRPPSGLQGQGNGLSFGSMGGGQNNQSRPVSMPQGPPLPQAQHLRRESSQSAHSDMSANRNFVPQAGRGRGYNGGYGAPSPVPQFRQPANVPRGPMPGQFQGQGPMGSPYRQNRSPAMAPATMQPQAQFAGQPQMPYGGYPQQFQPNAQPFYGMPQQHLDPTAFNPYAAYQTPYGMQPGMPFQGAAPPSPRPFQPQYIQGQYGAAPHAPGMSRTSSQVSERPPSTMGQPQTPSMAAASHVAHTPSQSSSSPAPTSNFTIPAKRQSKAIVIKNPDGEVLDLKKSASPAPTPSKSPIVVSSTPTPPPRAPSATGSQHGRAESTVKTDEEKRAAFQEEFKKQLAAEKEEERKRSEAAKAAKEKEEADAKAAKDKEEAEAKAAKEKEEAEAKAKEAEAKAKEAEAAAKEAAAKEEERKAKEQEEKERLQREEDERLEREIAEMEAAEREEEEREKAFQEKKKKEKEAAAAKEAEAAAKADEEMKRLEREAEERELAKEQGANKDESAEAKALFASLKKPTFGPAAAAAEAEAAMPPPAQPASKAAAAKPKPAALKLETKKPIEPPAPTPGMQALKSARFLQVQSQDIKYPSGIKSPNPALNQGGKTKGRQYDKDFLLQFQEVFKEKPSVDWDNKLKETVGDGSESARPGSARTPSSLGGRSNSRPISGVGGSVGRMGNFGAAGGLTLPPGTTSEHRFQMSQGMASRPPVNNPLASLAGGRGGFPMGSGAVRSSSYSMPAASSPRSGSTRKGTSRTGGRGQSRRDEEKAAQNMPLTANMELKPLERSTSGWVPTSLTQPAAAQAPTGNLAPDLVQRKVKAALNKMTPEKFDRIADQILEIAKQSEQETDGRTLRQVIQLTFEKACDEAHWASMYAKFCKRMLETMSPEVRDEKVRDKNGNPVVGGNLFRKYLLNRCQEDFEQGWESNLPVKKESEGGEEVAMMSDEYYVAAAAKRKGLGLIQFIGELYKLGMLTVRIMHECVMRLLNFEGMPDESNVESLVKLLRTVGATMESDEKGAHMIRAYFERIEKVMNMPGLPSRMHFMLLDTVELRRKGWRSKDDAKGPKTIQEIREEAAAAQQAAELEKMKSSQRGGGGRMAMGRGDARSFSGGGMAPPPDYNRNTLGMDDLRKLSKNASGRASSSGPGTFGPSSMFTSRSGSGRRGLGPGGSLGRGGDDSGNSSRTGTPPVKDKEPASTHHINSFSALAALEGGDEGPSPEHDATSPPAAKVQPATEEKKEAPAS
ncbi:uncharacterized protein K452DRAFT_295663 [Aplosporella prunicola CBS 121167]|uniref:MIF4G domain-containing protein n=1 Tax=Aplosporella prunicola CBS 121167 TaxID=1176127 RepID=A0A6A6BN48_9PEZI|nr:uncharacterized protein K452DRAFT_295663 [Aplosporella prunicola CBS 121167]KAF2145118.1 hypothetical protein K452DRAFT_295663 [Aplosporella prunicola CBS 121167]